jgi:hypothetical protein
MNFRNLLLSAIGAFCLLIYGAPAANAQCQNQGCQRPPAGSTTFSCIGVSGDTCTLTSGSTSCTESTCQSSGGGDICTTDPTSQACICEENPVADGCVNPCLNDPNATVCCGTQIICESGGGGGGGFGGGGGGGGTCIEPGSCDFQLVLRRASWSKDLAMLVPVRPRSGGCPLPNLPNKLLFSL